MSSQLRTAQPGTAAGQETSDNRSEAMDTTQQSHQRHGLSAGPTQTKGTAGPAESDAARLQSSKAHFYDSDADSLGSELISEEDVLYSEGEDERNELWAQQQRQGRHSDAILSCPGCLTTVCIDCQVHTGGRDNQFRAMFVLPNTCRVATHPRVVLESKVRQRGKRRRDEEQEAQDGAGSQPATAGDLFYPVECEVCDTELGLRDSNEVYHFFHVVPST